VGGLGGQTRFERGVWDGGAGKGGIGGKGGVLSWLVKVLVLKWWTGEGEGGRGVGWILRGRL